MNAAQVDQPVAQSGLYDWTLDIDMDFGGDEPDYLYGKDVHAAVIDEASRVKEASYHAVRSTLTATRGPIRIIGNVKGRKNWFFKMARLAEKGEDVSMGYHKLICKDAVDAGVLSQDEVDDAKMHLPDAVFRELYLAEPSDDQGNPFGLEAIRKCTRPEIANTSPVVWGWDLAKRENWTVGIGLDRQGNVCRFVRMHHAKWDTITNCILAETGIAPALVDATGVGDPILERLQDSNRKFEGYNFTMPSKQRLMEGLAVAIQRQEISFPEGVIVDELEAFEFVYNEKTRNVRYSAPDGFDDDCVMALALAVMHRSHASSYDMTMAWVGGPSTEEEKALYPAPEWDQRLDVNYAFRRRWDPQRGWHG